MTHLNANGDFGFHWVFPHSYSKRPFIGNFPIENGDFPKCVVCLPKGSDINGNFMGPGVTWRRNLS